MVKWLLTAGSLLAAFLIGCLVTFGWLLAEATSERAHHDIMILAPASVTDLSISINDDGPEKAKTRTFESSRIFYYSKYLKGNYPDNSRPDRIVILIKSIEETRKIVLSIPGINKEYFGPCRHIIQIREDGSAATSGCMVRSAWWIE